MTGAVIITTVICAIITGMIIACINDDKNAGVLRAQYNGWFTVSDWLDLGRIYQTLGGVKLEDDTYAVTLRGGSDGKLVGCVMKTMPPQLFRYDAKDKLSALDHKPQLTRVDQKV